MNHNFNALRKKGRLEFPRYTQTLGDNPLFFSLAVSACREFPPAKQSPACVSGCKVLPYREALSPSCCHESQSFEIKMTMRAPWRSGCSRPTAHGDAKDPEPGGLIQ